MTTNIDSLRDIYLDVADDETITQHQRGNRSREPIDDDKVQLEAEVSSVVLEDGLDDAVAGADLKVDISG